MELDQRDQFSDKLKAVPMSEQDAQKEDVKPEE